MSGTAAGGPPSWWPRRHGRRAALSAALLLAGCQARVPAGAEPHPAQPAPRPTPAEAPPSDAPARDPGSAADAGSVPVREDGTIFAEATLMGTRVSMNVWVGAGPKPAVSPAAAGEAIRAAFAEIARIEDIASEWREESELSRLNRSAGVADGGWSELSPELFELLERSAQISARTGGRFDVTFHGVGALWSFVAGAEPPTQAQIEAHLPLVDYRHIELDRATRRARLARPGVKVGLGAIAKGYAVDRAADLLRERGLKHFIVEGGGDTYVSGTKGGKAWRVGIQDPGRRGALGSLEVRDEAVVTSGNYERYFEHEGRRYAHILDPRTGWPVPLEQSPTSVSIVAPNATDADALCTAVMVMGTVEGLAFVESQPELEAIIVEGLPTGPPKITVSSGLRERFTPTPAP